MVTKLVFAGPHFCRKIRCIYRAYIGSARPEKLLKMRYDAGKELKMRDLRVVWPYCYSLKLTYNKNAIWRLAERE